MYWSIRKVRMGASRMPAMPASAPPMSQLPSPIACGEYPSAASDRGFSAAAEVARPKLVYRVITPKARVSTAATPKMMSLSAPTLAPSTVTGLVDSSEGTRTV